jgi:aminoglycoside phosphotransferase (APT) family kinase protein
MNDGELARALGATEVRRQPWPYASTAVMEELHVDGPLHGRRLLLKHLGDDRGLRVAIAHDPLRELAVYRDLLSSRSIDAPACHAAVAKPPAGWLVLDLVDGTPLWQIGNIAVWRTAARWLAKLHAADPPPAGRLFAYDAEHLRLCFRKGSFPGSERVGSRVGERLGSLRRCFVHGEFYPSNVLVVDGADGRRICAVDWETAGIGPGVLDIAALTAGSWSDTQRDSIVSAYLAACPPDRRPQAQDVEYARLAHAAQWLSVRDRWTPPPHHAHDWEAEVRSLVSRLAL